MRYPQERLTRQIVGATTKLSSKRKNLGWAKVMASDLEKYKIEVDQMNDKESYRKLISSLFFKSRKPATVDQAKSEGESQQRV